MADVTFTAVTQPAPACYPPDFNALMQMIVNLALRGTVPDNSGGGIFVGSTQPTSSLTNKVWFVIDVAGRPLGIKMFYNGNWRPVYTGAAGDVKLWGGNPSGNFDGTGRGILGTWHDGWALCNGLNGTYNLIDRFIVCASRYVGQWVADVDPYNAGVVAGGAPFHVIQPTELPHLSAHIGESDVGGGTGGKGLSGGAGPPTALAEVFTGAGAPVGGQAPFTTLPPYYALAYIQFIGYQ